MYYQIPFDRNCSKCKLSCGVSVSGQSEVPFNKVLLIVVSAYPGNNEIQQNISLAPATKKGKATAGEYVRFCLNKLIRHCSLPEPFSKYVYFTNAIKCSPFQNTVLTSHIDKCKEAWLDLELSQFDSKVPIMIASSQAVKALLGKKESLYANTNKVIYYEGHPCVVTPNPIEWERGLAYKIDRYEDVLEDLITLHRKGKATKYQMEKLIKTRPWNPPAIGSSTYFVKRDLSLVLKEVINYAAKINSK